MNKSKNYDIVLLVTVAASLVTVVRYSSAFVLSDVGELTGKLSEIMTIAMGITGLGMGILDVVGGAYLFNGWRKAMPRTGQKWSFRFKVLTFFVFGLIMAGMIILIPFTVSRISHESIIQVLGDGAGKWLWSGMVNIIPYFLIGGMFAGNKIISDLELSENTKVVEQKAPEKEKVSGKLPRDWRKLRPTLTYQDIISLSKLNSTQIKEFSQRYDVDERTVINWRIYANKEINNG